MCGWRLRPSFVSITGPANNPGTSYRQSVILTIECARVSSHLLSSRFPRSRCSSTVRLPLFPISITIYVPTSPLPLSTAGATRFKCTSRLSHSRARSSCPPNPAGCQLRRIGLASTSRTAPRRLNYRHGRLGVQPGRRFHAARNTRRPRCRRNALTLCPSNPTGPAVPVWSRNPYRLRTGEISSGLTVGVNLTLGIGLDVS